MIIILQMEWNTLYFEVVSMRDNWWLCSMKLAILIVIILNRYIIN